MKKVIAMVIAGAMAAGVMMAAATSANAMTADSTVCEASFSESACSAIEDNVGRYTVVFENLDTLESFEGTAVAAGSDEFTVHVDGLTAGMYNVVAFDSRSPFGGTQICAYRHWDCSADDGEVWSVRANLSPVASHIDTSVESVHESVSTNFTIVLQNIDTLQTYQKTATIDFNHYDTAGAYFTNLPAGTYNAVVYTLNAESGNTSLCASSQITLDEDTNVNVCFALVTSNIFFSTYTIHNNIV